MIQLCFSYNNNFICKDAYIFGKIIKGIGWILFGVKSVMLWPKKCCHPIFAVMILSMLYYDMLQIEELNKHLFITAKPMIYLINMSTKDYARKKNKW